ncbi:MULTISPECIES: GntR family transcriptional regulator [Aminobacterium]|uniref:Transcriptional regulator, GntR family n=1 Tax=Aminobacterium colombiense (strain DSM 12261 / ALA-1) TaxID=572547 RepID=D5EH44_AMICL|nr:transcriptional regulator, GntR family [Aminobacterium colombiense DSM 12261]
MRHRSQVQSSVDYAYKELRHKIMNKEFKPGQRLPEIAIAEQLNVSRTPVREAFRQLANEGLINIFPNEGASLVNPSKEEIENTFEMRAYLECLAIKKAVHRITPLQLCMLEEEIQKEESIFAAKDLDKYLEINNAFHKIIAEASGNVVLYEFIVSVLSRSFVYLVLFESFFDFGGNPSLDEHREIVKALRNRDEERAVELMRAHVLTSAEGIRDGSGARS